MINISDNGKEKLKRLNQNDIFVVADFDRTISTGNSKATFSLFSLSGLYGSEYEKERSKVHDFYRPIELDTNMDQREKFDLMREWAVESYKLMLKYKVRESDVEAISRENKLLQLRNGVVEFINTLNELRIPLIINSAGIGNFIECILKLNGCYSDNIFISANFLSFENDVIVDSITNITHSMNKYDVRISDEFMKVIKSKKTCVLIGDQLSDLNMDHSLSNDSTISFGFLESNVEENEKLFNEQYDVVLKDSETFDTIGKLLRLK